MISCFQQLSKLESWIRGINPNNIKFVWIDFSYSNDFKSDQLYDIYGRNQSFVLKSICDKYNIPYHVYSASLNSSDQERLLEFSKFMQWKSENFNTILIGKILKEQIYFGEYKKYYFDVLDISPFGDMTESQLKNLVHFIHTNEDLRNSSQLSKLEWLYQQDLLYNIISSESDPTKHSVWGIYSLEQKSLIAKYYALFKNRHHKIQRKNIFTL